MNIPRRKPDLNPIEHALNALEKGMKANYPTSATLTELWTALADLWQAMSMEHYRKLFESTPRRVAVIINTRRGPNRY